GELRPASPVRPTVSSSEGKIIGSPRIGEVQPTKEKEKERKVPDPDLRRRVCPNGACKEPEPNPEQSDLRRRICKDGPCPCRAGHSPGHGRSLQPGSLRARVPPSSAKLR